MKLTLIALTFLSVATAAALEVKNEKVILEKLSDYDLCQQKDRTGEWCHDALVRWVDAHPDDAFEAGKMTRKQMNAWNALEFFEKAFERNKGKCDDHDVELAVLGGLDFPRASNSLAVERAHRIGVEKCFPQMQKSLVENAKLGSNTFKNVCFDLLKKGLLNGLKKKKCEPNGKS